MKDNRTCHVGSQVILSPQQWLRPKEMGLIIDDGKRRWVVQFEESFPGGGIDGGRLRLDQGDFAEIINDVDRLASMAETPPWQSLSLSAEIC